MPYISDKDLSELIALCKMENFRCWVSGSGSIEDRTAQIVEDTRLYRETWIIPILEKVKAKGIAKKGRV